MNTREPIVLDSTNPPETVQKSLSEHLIEIKRLHDVRINPSLKPSIQEYEFLNNQQKFILHIQFGKEGIECVYEDKIADPRFKRPAASPIKSAVNAIFETQLTSQIGEQVSQNILGSVGMFHHDKKPQQPTLPHGPSGPKPPITG